MPTKNRIRVLLAENHETAKSIVPMLPNVDRVSMSYIVQGRVLPTKDTLNAMTAALNCEKKDLYDLNDIDLAGFKNTSDTLTLITPELGSIKTFPIKPIGDHGHDGMVRMFFWIDPERKEAIQQNRAKLGYITDAEWFRECDRNLAERAAKLDGKTLHEAAREGK